jgi:hypothetical protein
MAEAMQYTVDTQFMCTADPRSKAWVCGHSLAGIAGSNAAGAMDLFLL